MILMARGENKYLETMCRFDRTSLLSSTRSFLLSSACFHIEIVMKRFNRMLLRRTIKSFFQQLWWCLTKQNIFCLMNYFNVANTYWNTSPTIYADYGKTVIRQSLANGIKRVARLN